MPIRETKRRKLSKQKSERKTRGEKIIRLPVDEKEYEQHIQDKDWFHSWLARQAAQYSSIFPLSIQPLEADFQCLGKDNKYIKPLSNT